MTEKQPVSTDQVVREVMSDPYLLDTLNNNPAKVVLSPDGKEAELSIAEVVPVVVMATVAALDKLGVIDFTPETQPEQESVG